jgi:hypothetical protein
VEHWIAMTHSPDLATRVEAITALRDQVSPAAHAALLACLNDSDAIVVVTAANAVATTETEKTTEALVRVASKPENSFVADEIALLIKHAPESSRQRIIAAAQKSLAASKDAQQRREWENLCGSAGAATLPVKG